MFAQLQRIISNTSAGTICIPSGVVIGERLLESSSFTQPYLEGPWMGDWAMMHPYNYNIENVQFKHFVKMIHQFEEEISDVALR